MIQAQLYHVMVAAWTLMSAELIAWQRGRHVAWTLMSAESFDGYARGVTFAHIILVLGRHRGQLRAEVTVGRFMWELCVRVIRLSRHDCQGRVYFWAAKALRAYVTRSVQVGVCQNFVQGRVYFWAVRARRAKRAAPSPK